MLFVKRVLITLILISLSLVAYSVLAASVSVNANIPGGGGGGIIDPPPPPSIYGCTDPSANNTTPGATIDNGSCTYDDEIILGCTDSNAFNYNPSANTDDGSCVPKVYGCTNINAENYDEEANTNDGSCNVIRGCKNPDADNYDPDAPLAGGFCIFYGCTDNEAVNFYDQANTDDGSCIIYGCNNPSADNFNIKATIDDGTCVISGCTNQLAGNYEPTATVDDDSCIIMGCTDPVAVNYNNQATNEYNPSTCSYDEDGIPGCMDASALNYNSEATADNGSCNYPVSGCTDGSALNFNSSATINNDSCIYSLPVIDTPVVIGGTLDPISSIFEPRYYFFTNNNGLELLFQNNNINILINREILILIPDNFPKEVNKIEALVGGENLLFKYDIDSKQYFLNLNKFTSVGQLNIKLIITYQDNSNSEKNIGVIIHQLGHIFSKLPEDVTRLFGISVLLYDESNSLIRQLSKINSAGTYGFMVKNGRYKLVVYDNGEEIYNGRFFNVNNNIINRDIGLTLWEQIVKIVTDVLDNPVVEETNKYIAPTAVSVATVSAVLAIPWWSFVNYLQLLFTEPLAWLFRRKKRGWGVVYNSITKKPVDLAVVRLYDKTTGKLLKSRVTDKEGRYNFLVLEGAYVLEVAKPKMIFPSNILKDISEDKQFTNLYHGQLIDISKDQRGIITANIPVDPQDVKVSDKEILRKNFWYKIQNNISIIGPVLGIISFIIFPSVLIGSFAVLHIGLYFLFKRLVAKEKVNKWGVVLDAKTGQPMAGTVAKIYSPEYNKMLEAQVTDRHGRYGFLAGNNVYYIGASKEGYAEAKTDNIDLTHKKSEEVIGQDIELKPKGDHETNISSQDLDEESSTTDQKVETENKEAAETKTNQSKVDQSQVEKSDILLQLESEVEKE